MVIVGRIRDIQPNKSHPTLELNFCTEDRRAFPQGTRAEIVLDLKGARWHGTMRTDHPNNPPYFHTHLRRDGGV
jgi:hypothetical protein